MMSEQVHACFTKNRLVIRTVGVLTLAERQLGKSFSLVDSPRFD